MIYTLTDIFDINELQQLCENFCNLTGVATAIVDLSGNLLASSGWQEICKKFHRENQVTLKQCIASEKRLMELTHSINKITVQTCGNNLKEVVSAIKINNEIYGYCFIGQFFLEKPNLKNYTEFANKHNFDTIDYLNALMAVPVLKQDFVIKTSEFFLKTVETMGYKGLSQKINKQYAQELEAQKNKLIDINNEYLLLNKEYHQLNQDLITKNIELNIVNTELEKTLQDFKESEERYSTLFWNMTEGFAVNELIFDENNRVVDYRVLDINHSYENITGISKSYAVGKLATEIYGMPREQIQNFIYSSGVLDNNVIAEHYFEKTNDWYSVSTSVISGKKLITIFHKITEQKKSEAALRESENKLRKSEIDLKKAQEISHVGSWKWFVKDNKFEGSDELYNIFGIDKNIPITDLTEILKDIVFIEDVEKVMNTLLEVLREKKVVPLEFRITAGDKKIKYVWAEAGEFINDKEDQLDIISGIVKDITDQKLYELELSKAKLKAEESERLKTSFLQNMSHEIRTPMNAIVGFSEMLGKQDLTSEKRNHFVNIIVNSSKQLLSVVNDILTVSILDKGQEKINKEKVIVNNILVELLSMFRPKAQAQNVVLYLKQNLTEQESEIITDEIKLRQILTNLLSNALKFTHDGNIEFGYILKDDFLEFYVKDTGIGIEPENQSIIFERFRQADTTINKKYGGTGLGLAISKAYTELLGGKMWLLSAIGKGSTFYFTVPYILPLDQKQIKNHEFKLAVAKVLIAEDEEYNFLFLEELLLPLGFKIVHAKNGQEAVDFCKNTPDFDLVIMDLKMPVMNGFDATKLIKDFKPSLPVIALTAYTSDEDKFKAVLCGCSDFASKPIDKTVFMKILKKYVKIE